MDGKAKNIIEVVKSFKKMKKDSSKKKKNKKYDSLSTRRSFRINASGTFPSYNESKKKGKSPTVIEIDEVRESLVLSKKKKAIQAESPKERDFAKGESRKEMSASDDSLDNFDFMEFKPTFTPSKYHTIASKEHVLPSDQSLIPPPKEPFTRNYEPLITIMPKELIPTDLYKPILLPYYPSD